MLTDALSKTHGEFCAAYGHNISLADFLELKALAEMASAASGGAIGGTAAPGTVATANPVSVIGNTVPGMGANLATNPNKIWDLYPADGAIMAANPKRAVLIVNNTANVASCEVSINSVLLMRIPANSYWEMPQPVWKGPITVYNDNDVNSDRVYIVELSYV